jgi:LEA14-like dessication related protein
LTACQTPKGFDYRDVKNIKIEKLDYDKSTLSLELVYFNPNNFGVDLKKVDCDVYINSNYLGKYQLDTIMHIDKKSEFSLPSKMNLDMKDIFKNALTVFLNKEVLVTVKGSTRVGKAGIFVTVPFNYEGRHKVEVFN